MSAIVDERLSVNAVVQIDGKEMNFVTLSIDQSYGEHHRFSVMLDYDVIDTAFMSDPVQHMELIGKKVIIDLQQGKENSKAYVFKGIITDVRMTGYEGKHGYMILEGGSPTIMLERGKRMDVFSDMKLKEVADEVVAGVYGDLLTCKIDPLHDRNIEFLMQYKESDWEFLQRLAALYGESFFYSGSELLFGKFDDWEEEPLMYDREIVSYQLCGRLLPNRYTHYQYLNTDDTTLESPEIDTIEGANTFVKKAYERSQELTEKKPLYVPSEVIVGDPGEFKEMITREKSRTAARTVVFVGAGKTCHPRIGRTYKISLPDTMTERNDLGTWRVVRVKHTIDQNHRYSNEFEALPAKLKFMPVPELKVPAAGSVIATVVSNKDPENQGRVQVDFPFSQIHHSELWLRVMTPGGGGLVGSGESKSGIIDKNRGFVFIPEQGDQVMVGFEMGDPNRPYVMGSLFHGKNASGGQDNNHIKSIITRGGHTIEFDDADETLGITIKDKEGNTVHLNTKEKSITISAPEKITITSKEVNINGSDAVNITSEKLIKGESKKDIEMQASTGVKIKGDSKVNVDSKVIEEKANKVTISGDSKVEIAANSIDVNGKTATNIKGMPLKLN